MLFRTFEPYEDNIIIVEPKICFICYENVLINNNSRETPINLYNNKYYLKNCRCDSFIHKKCLDDWYNLHKSCPICRKSVIKNEQVIIIILNYNTYLIATYLRFIYIYVRVYLKLLKKFCIIFCYLYFVYFFTYLFCLIMSKL